MMIRSSLGLALIASAFVVLSAPRTWHDAAGEHRVEAEFVDFDGSKVRLEKPDHTIITVPIRGLSTVDRQYVAQNEPRLQSGQHPPSEAGIRFYGRNLAFLKLLGQKKWGETSPGLITGRKVYHAAGVVVDRSSTPNHIYVADTGNNRFLGFKSYDSPTPEMVLGQPNEFSGAANGDCNIGMYGRPGRTTLCLTAFPMGTNVAEQWMLLSFDVDAEGNLYVPDTYNNRVLIYRSPFSQDKTDGKGDNIPDLVIGQPDFTSNGINRGKGPKFRDARSLFISVGGFDHVASRGVSVDSQGNVWVADTFNFRVLRFPKRATTADLVLGQPSFTESQPACQFPGNLGTKPLDRMCTPTSAQVNPDTGELYVVNEYPGGFPARILVFTPPFRNGMAATRSLLPNQPLRGDYTKDYRLSHATGLVFNPVKTGDWIDAEAKTHRYRDGVFWVHDWGGGGKRTLLLDGRGNILLTIGAPDLYTHGCTWELYGRRGSAPETPFNLAAPGGMIGFDSANNIYLADSFWHRVARFAIPYRLQKTERGVCLPDSNGGLFPGAIPNSLGPGRFSGPCLGATVFRDQLIVRDHKRYMVWNDYLAKPDGADADLIVGQADGEHDDQDNLIYGRSMHVIDHNHRLWTASAHAKLMVYQLPMKAGAKPLRELIPLYWADAPDEKVQYDSTQPVAYDPRSRTIWIVDTSRHRLLRIRNPDDLEGKLLVDVVLGQKNKLDGALNRGMAKPDAASFGEVNDIRFDRLGNLFVVDNTYEGHPNGRVIAFLAEDLAKIKTMFPDIKAKRLYVTERFDQTDINRIHDAVDQPFSPVCIAFNSRNEMVIGNDGYYRDPRLRSIRQLYLYRKPLAKSTPDAVIELPLGAPGEITFDDQDNLIVQDHTWCKLWIINLDRDRCWLHSLP